METTDGDSLLSLIVGNFLPPDKMSGLLAVVFYNGTQQKGENVFRPLLDLEPLGNTTGTLSYTELNLMFNKVPRGPNDRHLFGGANFTIPLSAADGHDICDLHWKTISRPENANLAGSTMTFEYHPIHKIRQVELEDSAFGNRGQFASVCVTMNWTDASKDMEARSMSKMITKHVAERVGWKGDQYHDGTNTYANYFSKFGCALVDVFFVSHNSIIADTRKAMSQKLRRCMDQTHPDLGS